MDLLFCVTSVVCGLGVLVVACVIKCKILLPHKFETSVYVYFSRFRTIKERDSEFEAVATDKAEAFIILINYELPTHELSI